MNIDPDFDVQHRDCYESLQAMRDAGGADLIVFSPPYPDARNPEAYGAEFDTSLESYGRLGDAVFAALKPGGVCALNIDGPIRVWRSDFSEVQAESRIMESDGRYTERSLIAFKVAIDWAERVGFRYVERCSYNVAGCPGAHGPRWRRGFELVHVFARPGPISFDGWGYTLKASTAGRYRKTAAGRARGGMMGAGPNKMDYGEQRRDRQLTTDFAASAGHGRTDNDHEAPFSRDFADAYVRCYSPPGGLVGDPFVGSGTVAFAVHRAGDGRTFIGGDLGTRQTHNGKPCGRRWADIVNDGLRQGRLFS